MLLVILLGFSVLAWLIPLVVLAIPPILVNAYEGVAGVDPGLKDAARGMGMTPWQQLRKVEVPVALPLIMLGLRTGAIFVVATATIAAEIGLGGLGRYIIDGLATEQLRGGGGRRRAGSGARARGPGRLRRPAAARRSGRSAPAGEDLVIASFPIEIEGKMSCWNLHG